MVVDDDGMFVTQRELPRMALIQPQLRSDDLVLRAPGMLALHLRIDVVEAVTQVQVWDDEVPGLRHGRRRRPVVQRLPGAAAPGRRARRARTGWCVSTPNSAGSPA